MAKSTRRKTLNVYRLESDNDVMIGTIHELEMMGVNTSYLSQCVKLGRTLNGYTVTIDSKRVVYDEDGIEYMPDNRLERFLEKCAVSGMSYAQMQMAETRKLYGI